jgi:hypothetical protein
MTLKIFNEIKYLVSEVLGGKRCRKRAGTGRT